MPGKQRAGNSRMLESRKEEQVALYKPCFLYRAVELNLPRRSRRRVVSQERGSFTYFRVVGHLPQSV